MIMVIVSSILSLVLHSRGYCQPQTSFHQSNKMIFAATITQTYEDLASIGMFIINGLCKWVNSALRISQFVWSKTIGEQL